MRQIVSGILHPTCTCAIALGTMLLLAIGGRDAAMGQQAPPPAPEAGTKITQNVDEVSLDMAVHDKKHKLVFNLRPEDISVTDDDLPVKLNGFHLVQGDTTRAHLVTLVFDRFNGSMARDARGTAQKVLKALPSSGYSFSLLDLGGRLRLVQGFTDDRKTIDRAISLETESRAIALESTHSREVNIVTDKAEGARLEASEQAERDTIAVAQTGVDATGRHVNLTERARAQMLLAALQDAQKIVQEQHTYRSLAGLLALVKAQQKMGERKALIYFTQNRQIDSAGKEMVKTISAAATRAGVTIYTVDMDALNDSGQAQVENALLNGQAPYDPKPIVVGAGGGHVQTVVPLRQQAGTPIAGTPSGQGPVWGTSQDIQLATDFMRGNERGNPFADIKSPMADLAGDTGGVYIDAQNNLKKPLQQMVEDMNTYYEASYVPPITEYDGKFRAIAVRPMRADLRIQAKSGYFAVAPGAEAGIRPFEVPLLKALAGADLPADLGFHAAVLRFGHLPDGDTSTFAVEVPIAGLETREDVHTNLFSAHVSIVAQVKDKDGAVLEHFSDDVTKRGALESLDRDRSENVTLARHFISPPGTYTAEVAVMDQFSGKISAQRFKFDIARAGDGLGMSDMVLVRGMEPFHEDDDPVEPLRYEHNKVTPNVTGKLAAQAKGVSLFLMLHPDASSKEVPALVMEVARNGRPGRETTLPMRLGTPGTPIPYLANFGTAALAPGDYVVKALLTQGSATATQTIAFTVDGPRSDVGTEVAALNQPAEGGPAANNSPATSTDDGHLGGILAITPALASAAPPSTDETATLLADTRKRAVGYNDSLPNFMCIEVTSRSIDANGDGGWKQRDTITELLRFREKSEAHTTLEVNGKANNTDREAMKGTFSAGEFGGVLKAVFADSAKADFHWKEADSLNGGTLQVFEYRVDKANSMFSVAGSNGRQLIVGFHGLVYVDGATRSVRRVTLVADDLPRSFPTHASSIGVDYDYVAINAHDYLMPVSAELRVQQGKRETVLNTIEFRNYRRFGSNLKILGFTPVVPQ